MVLSAQGSRAPGPNPKEPEDSEELARFRAEWRAELARRKAAEQSEQKGKQPEETQGQAEAKLSTRNANHRPPIRALTTGAHVPGGSAQKQQVLPLHPAIQDGKLASALGKSSTLSAALQVYKQAVQHEQRQDLDTALILYRQAFRLDPHVDRAYHREELLQAKLQEYKEKATVHLPPSEAAEVKQLVSGLQQLALKTTTDDRQRALTGSLAKITAGFPSDIQFEPEDEKQPVHLNILPPEMLFAILRNLDVTSLERFATVSRKARLLTLDPVYWSDLVTKTYKPPQLQNIEDLLPVIEKYNSDFRRVYIEHPRIRMDGVYIATCHYVRAGISEDAWMSRSHLITYHRYLRFYPNGQVLSLLANEQLSPQDVIPMLKPTLRMKVRTRYSCVHSIQLCY
ncbi:hypothetical protein CC2G_011879 [Coprinopsis cinerea AmutBmut pab1-1]|nr:hypothetical protein CC2G_011879 [Coprinopsis cinerea AmutBmut pab1-1]